MRQMLKMNFRRLIPIRFSNPISATKFFLSRNDLFHPLRGTDLAKVQKYEQRKKF